MSAGYVGFLQIFDDNNKVISRSYIDETGKEIERVDGYSCAKWIEKDGIYSLRFYDLNGEEVPLTGINLAKDVGNDWSEWITPKYNSANSTGVFGTVNLGEKKKGDIFTCQIEIEFRNVSATPDQSFRFRTQGAQDGKWKAANIWNASLINLTEVPEDGIYTFTVTSKVTEKMIGVSTFNLGFRCDNWASGSFRVRNIKVEVGEEASEWTPGI